LICDVEAKRPRLIKFGCAPQIYVCRSVTRLDGARGKKKIWRPIFEPEAFRKQMYCIEESGCDIVGTFRRPLQL